MGMLMFNGAPFWPGSGIAITVATDLLAPLASVSSPTFCRMVFMRTKPSHAENRGGFSLLELTVVVVIVGVLAVFAVPRFLQAIERAKAAEAFEYLMAVRAAQERYLVQHGQYASSIDDLDVELPALEHFTVGTLEVGETSWKLTLNRAGAAAGYGAYTVIFEEEGYNKNKSTIPPELLPVEVN
jgi:type IV pilus assembly protein PilA